MMGLQERVKPVEVKNSVLAQRHDKKNFEPTFPRVFGPGTSAVTPQARPLNRPAMPVGLHDKHCRTASSSLTLQDFPGTSVMRESYKSAEGHLDDNMRNNCIVHQGQRQSKVCK